MGGACVVISSSSVNRSALLSVSSRLSSSWSSWSSWSASASSARGRENLHSFQASPSCRSLRPEAYRSPGAYLPFSCRMFVQANVRRRMQVHYLCAAGSTNKKARLSVLSVTYEG